MIDRLKGERHRSSTRKLYYGVWRQFNEFFILLDNKPASWEDRLILFVGHLIEKKVKSTTVKSYISAVKAVLQEDGITIHENKFLLNALTRSCRLQNDRVQVRFPIQKGMLNILLNHTGDYFHDLNQPFLATLYQTLFSTAYFGLFRVGELTSGSHPIMARDVHIGVNKDKMMFILRSSKTHSKGTKPQSVKICSTPNNDNNAKNDKRINYHCPFNLIREYAALRGDYNTPNEPFFVFADKTPVKPCNMRTVLKDILQISGFQSNLYNTHSFRSGRSLDLLRKKVSVRSIMRIGRWRSNAVFTYLNNF